MLGARADEWSHFDLVLGLGGDLLPVVPDAKATPSPGSKIKQFGKIPSAYDREGNAHGLKDWQKREITADDITRWSADRRLGLCVRASALRAIDVDVTDPTAAATIDRIIDSYLLGVSRRIRSNSPKFLVPFLLDGAHVKRIINTAHGRIEFLADGQQFLAAGCHPSGSRYEWRGGMPAGLRNMTLANFEELWAKLQAQFGTSEPIRHDAQSTPVSTTSNDDIDLADLDDALAYPPLVSAAADNGTWSEIGYSLLPGGHYERWAAFCRAAPNYTAGCERTWWDAHQTGETRSNARHIFTMALALGWRAQAPLDAFPIIEAQPSPPFQLVDEAVAALLGEGKKLADAHHKCTDLANAHRLRAQFGAKLISVAGSFYSYNGTHWERDEAAAASYATGLSTLVRVEAKAAKARLKAFLEAANEEEQKQFATMQTNVRPEYAAANRILKASKIGIEILETNELVAALEKWSKACEMVAVQNKALELLRKVLAFSAERLDVSPELFNCLNGTINLRTGAVHAHRAEDYLTKCAPTRYNVSATADRWKSFVRDITDEPRAAFLQRWFGYCITGETREQKIVLHIGEGSNGKSTMFRAIKEVIGDYMHTAAPHLLTAAGSERHPTEIADLLGRRVVVAHESDDGAALREGFIKQASGEDVMAARFLFKDFFQFVPTFKLQLLTNHKPVVKGSDFGIWRRLLLMWYSKRYGSDVQIAAHEATHIGDPKLPDKLAEEREGILAWLVCGARDWYANGLQPPKGVVEDSAAYRTEQDRVRQFVTERCLLNPNSWAPLSGAFGALYPAYTSWCKENGYMALSVSRFSGDIRRVASDSSSKMRQVKVNGSWRTANGIQGIALNLDDDSGFVPVSNNEDLL